MSANGQVSEGLYREVTDFLLDEAEMLDAGRYREWLQCVTDDVEYVVPVRVTRERAAETDVIDNMAHMDENHDSLEMRVLRLETEYAWAEDPPSRSRHFVSNIRLVDGDKEDEIEVKSNLLLYRTRGDVAKYDLISGERRDVLRRENGGWKLARRRVILDQSTVLTHNFALFF